MSELACPERLLSLRSISCCRFRAKTAKPCIYSGGLSVAQRLKKIVVIIDIVVIVMTCAIKAKLKDLQRMGKADGPHCVPRRTGFPISFPRRTDFESVLSQDQRACEQDRDPTRRKLCDRSAASSPPQLVDHIINTDKLR